MRIQDIKAVHPRLFKNMFIKDWYVRQYPEDDLGQSINPFLKFYDLRIVLDNHYDIYFHLGVGDSVVRSRVFARLAELLNVPYDTIYGKWVENA